MPPILHRHPDRARFVRAVVDDVGAHLRAAHARSGEAMLAVPAGRTMGALLPVLAAQALPWDRIVVTLVDERWVPPSHPDSNETAVRMLFAGATGVRVQGLFTAALTPERAALALAEAFHAPDVVLLAMADDGHIGSLFPHDPANEATAPYAVVARPDHVRITMTPAAFAAARTIVLAVDGPAKAALLERALSDGRAADLPVRHALRAGARVHVGAE